MTDKLRKITIEEWRQLGYYYNKDDVAKQWILTASPCGLGNFVNQLRTYAADPTSAIDGEHDHWGPYMYLKVLTWPTPGMDANAIHGRPEALEKLAAIVNGKLFDENIGKVVTIREEYSADCEYALVLRIRDYGTDPSREDKQLWQKTQ